MTSTKTAHNIAVITFDDGLSLDRGGHHAVQVLNRLSKGSFVNDTCPVKYEHLLREYVEKLQAAGLPLGRGQNFNYLIGQPKDRPNDLRLTIYRRRAA
ncbi:MAG: hypothetical protein AABY00_02230 [Nanoarchaeota archaeon]